MDSFQKISFLLNDRIFTLNTVNPSVTLADIVRKKAKLTGTTIACREGDCGSCTLIVGTLQEHSLKYQTVTSCISPLLNAHGAHIVTIEGLSETTLLQNYFKNEGATQCGFCTPGFIISIIAHLLSPSSISEVSLLTAIDGNICRCTGYQSIKRALSSFYQNHLTSIPEQTQEERIQWLVAHYIIPAFFLNAAAILQNLNPSPVSYSDGQMIGGGTDLFVKQADFLYEKNMIPLLRSGLDKITTENDNILVPAQCSIEDFRKSSLLNAYFPGLNDFLLLFASTPIRQQGTVAGNLVNASPIGDLISILLALDVELEFKNNEGEKRLGKLRNFYLSYKKTDLKEKEMVTLIRIPIQRQASDGLIFNFEKVSKRKKLDIASVNTSIFGKFKENTLGIISLSAGGVAPIPLYCEKTSHFLSNKKLSAELLANAYRILHEETSPISDIRGSVTYKRLLLRNLFYAHFENYIHPLQFGSLLT